VNLLSHTVSHRSVWYTLCEYSLRCKANRRVIQKISSVCEYFLCSAAVTIVHMGAEFVDSVARHGRNLRTFELCLRIVLCVYNV